MHNQIWERGKWVLHCFSHYFQQAVGQRMTNSMKQPKEAEPLCGDLSRNIERIKAMTGGSSDINVHTFQGTGGSPMAVIYINGLTDSSMINEHIMKPLITSREAITAGQADWHESFVFVKDNVLVTGATSIVHTIEELMSAAFAGNTVILAEGWRHGIAAGTAKWQQRGVEEPSSQTVIRGPKEGFTEDLHTNVALLRRKIKSPDLWRVDRKIGTLTQTDVSVIYLKGIASDSVVDEVLRRLDRIETDSILESGYLEEFIQDATFTPFPTIINTERPDVAAAAILEGQVAIFTDGTPFVLVLPITFFKFFLASEDYYQRFDIASFLRVMRFAAFSVSMLLPSLYIAITTFHQEMLPTRLLISLAGQREGVPFPAFIEALLMEITFEVLREAGLRMPRAIGPAISIVGALVLGQAAVEAGLVSAAMIIVVSFTAISSFVAPVFSISIAARLIRFVFMVLAGTLGLIGIMSGLFFMMIHMAGLRSFGIPYLAPVSPFVANNWKDIFVRVPRWMMRTRPRLFARKNTVRQSKNLRPKPPVMVQERQRNSDNSRDGDAE